MSDKRQRAVACAGCSPLRAHTLSRVRFPRCPASRPRRWQCRDGAARRHGQLKRPFWPSDARPPGLQLSDFNATGPTPLGDEPKLFDQLPGTNSGHGSGYNPLYPFGFGLSYTTFSTSGLSISGPADRVVIASFTVTNTGGREGADVVPVYVKRPVNTGEVLTPANGTLVRVWTWRQERQSRSLSGSASRSSR